MVSTTPPTKRRYAFDEVRAALRAHWGLDLQRGGNTLDEKHDGRWDTCYSKTGYIVSGSMPGIGHSHRRFRSLSAIVRVCDLSQEIAKGRRR